MQVGPAAARFKAEIHFTYGCSLHYIRLQVGPAAARFKAEIHFNPQLLSEKYPARLELPNTTTNTISELTN